MRRIGGLLLGLLLLTVQPTTANDTFSNLVLQDQQLRADATFIIPSMNITEEFVWLVIHTNYNSSYDPLEGAIGVTKGIYTDYVFQYQHIETETKRWIMLHNDTVPDREFDLLRDVAIFDRNGIVVVREINLTPASQTEDITVNTNTTTQSSVPQSTSNEALIPGTVTLIALTVFTIWRRKL